MQDQLRKRASYFFIDIHRKCAFFFIGLLVVRLLYRNEDRNPWEESSLAKAYKHQIYFLGIKFVIINCGPNINLFRNEFDTILLART
jgi:hypothetical protein